MQPHLAKAEEVDDMRRPHAVVLPAPIHKVLIRVVQHQPGARCGAQRGGALHLLSLQQHACGGQQGRGQVPDNELME